MLLLIILFLIAIGTTICVVTMNKKEVYKEDIKYFTGNIYSANAAANMLDYINDNNKVISPFNISSSLAILYNGSDNNSTKELQSYFKKNLKDTNNDMQKKLSSLNQTQEIDAKYKELYESLISELESLSYHELTISKIGSLSKEEKEKLQLIIKKISLTYEYLNHKNNLSEKVISNYKLSEKEKTYNEYTLKTLLDEVLYNHESYKIMNRVTDYHELYNNNILNEKNINQEFLDSIKMYNFNITSLDFSNTKESALNINNKIKSISYNEINRVVEDKDLINNNYIMINSVDFNYEWNIPFKNASISSKEFYEFNNKVSFVDMMYIKDKESSYIENEYATGFIKNFKDGKYSFVGILPKSYEDFSLSNLNIDGLINSKRQESPLIGLPKFSIQYETDLVDLLSKYNITESFTNKSNFTKVSDEKISISKNVQKINIHIDELGTVKSNITKMNMETFEIEDAKKEVILNRPFAFLIINNETSDIMFIGKITKI